MVELCRSVHLTIGQHSHQSIDVELFSLFSLPFWTNFVPVCYLFRTFPQIFSDVWKEMYVARDIFSLFLLHLCRKLQRRAPFWGQSGRKSFTTKTFPRHTLPPLLCFQLPMTFMFNLPDSVLLLFCQPSLQSEDFARLDRKLLSLWQERFIFAFSKGNVLGSEYLSLWAMAWTNPIYSGNP